MFINYEKYKRNRIDVLDDDTFDKMNNNIASNKEKEFLYNLNDISNRLLDLHKLALSSDEFEFSSEEQLNISKAIFELGQLKESLLTRKISN